MSKYDKECQAPRVRDLKRIDPQEKIGNKRHKKVYPDHWQIRANGFIWPSKNIKGDTSWHRVGHTYRGMACYGMSEEYKSIHTLFMENKLDEALAVYAKYHPETADWPVRFIGIQPMDTKRSVLL